MKIRSATTNQKKVEVAILLISDKTDFKARGITREQDGQRVMLILISSL